MLVIAAETDLLVFSNLNLLWIIFFMYMFSPTPPQGVVTLLPHNHVTLANLFISSYKGATFIKPGQ